MKSRSPNKSGLILGAVLILLGLVYGVYIYLESTARSGNAFYTIGFLLLVGFLFMRRSKQGASAKQLMTKEDISKFTLLPFFRFKHYLILLLMFALIFLVFIVLGPIFEGKSIIP